MPFGGCNLNTKKISFKFYTIIIIRWFPPFSGIKYNSTLIPCVKASRRSINTSLSNEMSLSTRNKNNLEPVESKKILGYPKP